MPAQPSPLERRCPTDEHPRSAAHRDAISAATSQHDARPSRVTVLDVPDRCGGGSLDGDKDLATRCDTWSEAPQPAGNDLNNSVVLTQQPRLAACRPIKRAQHDRAPGSQCVTSTEPASHTCRIGPPPLAGDASRAHCDALRASQRRCVPAGRTHEPQRRGAHVKNASVGLRGPCRRPPSIDALGCLLTGAEPERIHRPPSGSIRAFWAGDREWPRRALRGARVGQFDPSVSHGWLRSGRNLGRDAQGNVITVTLSCMGLVRCGAVESEPAGAEQSYPE